MVIQPNRVDMILYALEGLLLAYLRDPLTRRAQLNSTVAVFVKICYKFYSVLL
jgi:hypothetical protein